jgi:hypothetical protein
MKAATATLKNINDPVARDIILRHRRWLPSWIALTTLAVAMSPTPTDATDATDHVAVALQRALQYLARETPSWLRDHACFSCHNNGDAARALYLATGKGHRVATDVLAETTAWLATPSRWDSNHGDPVFSDKQLANLQFALALASAVRTGAVTNREALQEAARRVLGDQQPDGSWRIEPPGNAGSPTTYGNALATYKAYTLLVESKLPQAAAPAANALHWLAMANPTDTPSAAAIVLAFGMEPETAVGTASREAYARLIAARTQEGGWGPYPGTPAEPFDTALALRALERVKPTVEISEMIAMGRQFLAAMQNPDGSWPETTRPAGGASYAQRISTTAWVVQSLLLTRDASPVNSARGQQHSSEE